VSQTAGQIESTTSPRRTRRFWWLKWIILCLVIALCPLLAIHYLDNAAADRALVEAVAEADRLDPGWRLEDIEAARRKIPDEKNGALVVLSAHGKMPAKWIPLVDKRLPFIEERLPFPPPVRLDDEFTQELRKDLEPVAGAIAEAQRLVDFPEGRFAITYPTYLLHFLPKHQQQVRTIGFVLLLDGWLRLQEGKIEQAWKSSRAIVNTARSLGDEPLLLSQMTRVALRRMAATLLERILAQGAISKGLLTEMQTALTEEASEPLLMRGLRGQRAAMYSTFLHWEKEGISWDELPRGRSSFFNEGRVWIAGKSAKLRQGNSWSLNFHTMLIEELKKPGVSQYQALKNLGKIVEEEDRKLIGWLLFMSVPLKMEKRSCNNLHTTIAALAAERFRLRNNRWPKSLDELVKAGLLKEIPIDLMDGKPLRFRRTIDGLVIYSVGADGTYRGDALDDFATFAPGKERPEFRLWDVNRRGVSK
jgi:hypothetical protein